MDPETTTTGEAAVQQLMSDPTWSDFITPVVILTFVLIAFANIAVITSIKNAVKVLTKRGVSFFDSAWAKASMEFSQPVLGGLAGAHADIFPDFPVVIGVGLGAVAGFMSPRIYNYVLKKYLPELVVSGDSGARKAARGEE